MKSNGQKLSRFLHRRNACVNCGFCERKCPQRLQIRKELDKVEALFKGME